MSNHKAQDEPLSSSPNNHEKAYKNSRWLLILKISSCFIAVYLGVAFGFAAFSPYTYSRRQQNFAHSLGTVILQPIMEAFANGLISHPWDWKNIDPSSFDKNVPGLQIISKTNMRNFNSDFDPMNVWVDLGGSQEAAIVKPIGYSGKWSLVFCSNENGQSFCKLGEVLHSGAVKILVDGNGPIWGMDENGNLLSLKLEGYIQRNQRRDLLLV